MVSQLPFRPFDILYLIKPRLSTASSKFRAPMKPRIHKLLLSKHNLFTIILMNSGLPAVVYAAQPLVHGTFVTRMWAPPVQTPFAKHVPMQPALPRAVRSSEKKAGKGKRAKNNSWSPEEDVRLYNAVQTFGVGAWSLVAEYVGFGRTRAQCSQRWARGLDPSISRSCWTRQEEEKLVELVQKYGTNQWVKVANELGGRCDVQCRYRYNQMVKRQNSKKRIPPIQSIIEEAGEIRAPPIVGDKLGMNICGNEHLQYCI